VTAVLLLIAVLLALLLALVSFVQLLYLEALRLRAREVPALEFFKETLEDRLRFKLEEGALAYSLIKHSSMVLLGVIAAWLILARGPALSYTLLETALAAWLVMMLAAYVVPHLLYRRTAGRWLLPAAPLVRALALLAKPLVSLLAFLQSLAELGGAPSPAEENADGNGEFEAFISAGAEEGLIEEDDRKLIHSVVAFGDKTVREVMTPRPNIVAIRHDSSLEELRELVIHEQFSRIPVYEDSIDEITGFVHVRDMFEMDYAQRAHRHVKELVRPVRFVPETKPVDDLFREMQHDGAHIAIVVDEYGNTAGLATMEDLVEEILGEIRDEHEPTQDVFQEADSSYLVSGSFDLDLLEDLLGFRPQEETESTTVGGLVTEWLGHVPQAGESVEREGIRIEVTAASERRVSQVRVSRTETGGNANTGQ